MIEISTHRLPGRIDVEVFMYEIQGDVITFFTPGKEGQVVGNTEKRTIGAAQSNQKPFMVVGEHYFREIAAAFKACAEEMGIKSKDLSFSEGKLIATEKHLADMRALVFEPKEVITSEFIRPAIQE